MKQKYRVTENYDLNPEQPCFSVKDDADNEIGVFWDDRCEAQEVADLLNGEVDALRAEIEKLRAVLQNQMTCVGELKQDLHNALSQRDEAIAELRAVATEFQEREDNFNLDQLHDKYESTRDAAAMLCYQRNEAMRTLDELLEVAKAMHLHYRDLFCGAGLVDDDYYNGIDQRAQAVIEKVEK